MMNWKNFIGGLFLVTLTTLYALGLAGETNPKVQATSNGDVKVSYYEGIKGTYWSSKYGISFEVGPDNNIWARELVTEKNPYGELPHKRLRKVLLAKHGQRIVDIREPGNRRYTITLRFRKGQQLSEDEIREWVEKVIGRFRSAIRYGLPDRETSVKIQIDGVTATKADYLWSGGLTSLVVAFRTEKGTYFFYARSASYKDMEKLLKTIKFVK